MLVGMLADLDAERGERFPFGTLKLSEGSRDAGARSSPPEPPTLILARAGLVLNEPGTLEGPPALPVPKAPVFLACV